MKYLLCTTCHRAWLGIVAAGCCNATPIVCSPWSSDARVWFRARLGTGRRAVEVVEFANYAPRDELRAALWRGVEQRGRAVHHG